MTYYIGIDVGGTFTDCVAVNEAGRVFHAKSLSTKGDPTDGMLNGLESLSGEIGIDRTALLSDAERFSHGTTIGTNLVVERKGAKVGLICTLGHRDAVLMMRGTGGTAGKPLEKVFLPHESRPPKPIVPRRAILEIEERVDRSGQVVVALDVPRARERIASWLAENRFDAVAICLLWSFRNADHELALANIVRAIAPQVFVSVSSQIAPRLGEFERTVAAVINAYVGPRSATYLSALGDRLGKAGLRKPVLVMQSNGGVIPAAAARLNPFTIIDSGPTGGLAGTATLALASGHRRVIATDMGGTSFDVGLVLDSQPVIASERTLDQYTYQLPHLDVRSIACGGGSIALVDARTRSIRVGPESAGSEPGPACYGRGGHHATVTDADVVLGLLRPEAFLGGRMPLDAAASRAAVQRLADQIGMSVEETAAGILRINNSNASLLIRQRTIEQGLDPRDFVLYAFGGAGPVHAFGFAAELGIRDVVIPLGNGASTLSAYGIASADAIRYFETECHLRAPFDADTLDAALSRAEAEARDSLLRDGFVPTGVERTLLMRYIGQTLQSMPVRIGSGNVTAATAGQIVADFEADYARLFGDGAKVVFQSIEAFALRFKFTGDRGFKAVAVAQPADSAGITHAPVRHEVYWPNVMRWTATAVIDGTRLSAATVVQGPALVELPHTTVAVAEGQRLSPDFFGSLVLSGSPVTA